MSHTLYNINLISKNNDECNRGFEEITEIEYFIWINSNSIGHRNRSPTNRHSIHRWSQNSLSIEPMLHPGSSVSSPLQSFVNLASLHLPHLTPHQFPIPRRLSFVTSNSYTPRTIDLTRDTFYR